MEKIELPSVRDMGQIVGDACLFMRENIKIIFRAYLYYAVPFLIVGVGLALYGGKVTESTYYYGSGTESAFRRIGTGVMWAYLIYMVVLLFQQFYITEFMLLKESNDDITNADVLRELKNDWAILLSTFFVMVLIGIVLVVVALMLIGLSSVLGSGVSGFFLFLYALFVIYLAIPLMNVFYIRLREKLSISESLAKAFRLSSGNWWRSFVAWIVVTIIYYSFSTLVLLIFSLIMYIVRFHNSYSEFGSTWYMLFATAFVGVSTAVSPFVSFFLTNLLNIFAGINYYNLSEKYDNYHLRAEIDMIGNREDANTRKQEGEF